MTNESLRIESMTLAGPDARPLAREVPGEMLVYTLTVVLENDSPKETMHIISEPRTLRYDASTKTLHVGLCEPQVAPGVPNAIHVRRLLPHQRSVPPGTRVELRLTIPKILHRLHIEESGTRIEDIDLSKMEHVECKVAVASAPFYGRAEESSDEMQARLHAWGAPLTHNIRVQSARS